MQGVIRHIDMQESEMNDYESYVTRTIHRYLQRMRWLLSGSRRFFGSILEKKVRKFMIFAVHCIKITIGKQELVGLGVSGCEL